MMHERRGGGFTGNEIHAEDLEEEEVLNTRARRGGGWLRCDLGVELEGRLRVFDANHRVIELASAWIE